MGGQGSGRPPKPLEQRQLDARGNNGRDLGGRRVSPPGTEIVIPGRINHPVAFDHEDGSLPPVPDYLGKAGVKAWFDVWDFNPHLHPFVDWPEVAILASCYDDMAGYRRVITTQGTTHENYKGETVAHPLIKSVRDAQMVILRIRDRLALNPISRARLGIAEVKRANSLADLQQKFANPAESSVAQFPPDESNESEDYFEAEVIEEVDIGEETDIR